jgi:hypothetical protein
MGASAKLAWAAGRYATGINPGVDQVYVAFECADEAAAIAAAVAASNATLTIGSLTLYRRQPEVTERLANDQWRVTLRYAPIDPVEDTSPAGETTVDTTGGTKHITTSLQVMNTFGSPTNACNGAIGYDGDSVGGCDITVPTFSIEEKRYTNTTDWVNWATLTGKVNNNTFMNFAAGEVLFLGVSGRLRRKGYTTWELNFKFAVSRNETNVSIGGFTNIAKNGWDYLDVQYAEALDDTSNTRIKKPVGGFIHRVYEAGNLSTLPV